MLDRSQVFGGLIVALGLGAPLGCGDGEGDTRDAAGSASSGGEAGAAGRATGPRACSIVAPTACSDASLAYADVAPIFEQRCVICHSGTAGGPWALNTYGHVATWRDTVRAALLACQMPPEDSGLDIPQAESELVLAWIRCGMRP